MRLSSLVLALTALLAGLPLAGARAQNSGGSARRGARQGAVKICRGISIPDGYIIVAETTSTECPNGAFVIKRDVGDSASVPQTGTVAPQPATQAPLPSRVAGGNTGVTGAPTVGAVGAPPVLTGPRAAARPASQPRPISAASGSEPEEVDEGEVVRVDTNLVTVPVSVFDRQGRFVTNLRKEDFRISEDGVEQDVAYFEPTESPFTVALLLDTSSSTRFRLWDIKDAAIDFARQLQPQDRVLIVTFDEEVLLLTEATSDQNVISAVVKLHARTGGNTRLYDAVDLVIRERLQKLRGRKAIVLFTDGVDTASYRATYESTVREVEELDALIYPIQYDTYDSAGGGITVTTRTYGGWFPGSSRSSGTVYGRPSGSSSVTRAEYDVGGRYLNALAEKTGGRVYNAEDPKQLARAFSNIAGELRRQYSLGYYPKATPAGAGERRQIRVRVRRPDLAVRARDGYVYAASGATR